MTEGARAVERARASDQGAPPMLGFLFKLILIAIIIALIIIVALFRLVF